MNPIHQCIQKISPGNHFSYVRDVRMYVRLYVRTDKGDAICPPPPIINGGGIIKHEHSIYMLWQFNTMEYFTNTKEDINQNGNIKPFFFQYCSDTNSQYLSHKNQDVGWLILLLYVPSQQLWSLRDGQFT